jgi:DNA-binding response OmpR family regulator
MTVEAYRVRPRAIVVEDDHDMSLVLRFLLERHGFDVVILEDGRQAVEWVDTQDPAALVLLDIVLPYISGQQVVKHLRSTGRWARVPVVMLSGKSAEQDMLEALRSGADDYVTKPFNPEILMARVLRLIGAADDRAAAGGRA